VHTNHGTWIHSNFLTSGEKKMLKTLHDTVCIYQFLKHTFISQEDKDEPNFFLEIQAYMTLADPRNVEVSKIAYLQVLDAVADNKDTVLTVLNYLNERFIKGRNTESTC
jgi:cysteinyl-tRNA synthetase